MACFMRTAVRPDKSNIPSSELKACNNVSELIQVYWEENIVANTVPGLREKEEKNARTDDETKV